MSYPIDNPRTRYDQMLRWQVAQTRTWMKENGVEETEPDWEAIARRERALWWRERLRRGLASLAGQAANLPAVVRATLSRLEEMAEAVVEVSLDATGVAGRVLFDPALAELTAGPLSFAHATATRAGGGTAEDESVGFVVSERLMPGARVQVDALAGMVTVEVMATEIAPVVVLVPEDPSGAPRVVQAVLRDGDARATFEEVLVGRYLVVIQPGESIP